MDLIFKSRQRQIFVVLLWGLVLNITWFLSSVYLEKNILNRTFIFTLLVYLALFSFVFAITYSKVFEVKKLFLTYFYVIIGSVALVLTYFILIALGFINILGYIILLAIYLCLITFIFSRLTKTIININFLVWHLLIALSAVLLHKYLLGSTERYDYGTQFLLSICVLGMSIFCTIHSRKLE